MNIAELKREKNGQEAGKTLARGALEKNKENDQCRNGLRLAPFKSTT
jgi:hypothetical protein